MAVSSVKTLRQWGYPIQGLGSYGGAEEKKPSRVRFTSQQQTGTVRFDIRRFSCAEELTLVQEHSQDPPGESHSLPGKHGDRSRTRCSGAVFALPMLQRRIHHTALPHTVQHSEIISCPVIKFNLKDCT